MADSETTESYTVHPDTRIGHVHLRVSDLARAKAFYTDVLGFDVMEEIDDAVFLSAGGYHHHIALNTWFSKGGDRPAPTATGLYHLAILYPDRVELARAFERVLQYNVPIKETEDHGVSEAIYFYDPDGNGIELYRDRDRSEWPRDEHGRMQMISKPIPYDDLLAELQPESVITTPSIQ